MLVKYRYKDTWFIQNGEGYTMILLLYQRASETIPFYMKHLH